MFRDLKPTAVLFDLYATLLNIWTDEDRPEVWDKLARFLRYRGLPADAGALYHTFFHLTRRDLEQSDETYPEVDVLSIFQTMLRDLGYAGPDELFVQVAHLFRALSVCRFELFPDALPTLQRLHPLFKTGLVSDAQRVFLEPEIRMTELEPLLDVIIVSSDHGFHKPDPRMFTMAVDRLGIEPGQAVYVGDSLSRDISGAQRAGMRAVLIHRDHGTLDLAGSHRPDRVIQSFRELQNWLLA